MNATRAAAVISGVMLLAGCASTASPGTAAPAGAQRAQPLASYLPTVDEVRLIRKAQGILVTSCASGYGLKTQVDGPLMDGLYEDARGSVKLPVALADAKKYGYHPAPQQEVPQNQQENPATGRQQSLNNRELLVLNGPKNSGKRPS
ncbi:hypothetical protein ACFYVL_38705 [Streptomyces sp. NPDC004111]|uniref:hypothetical protein n=1 Tax=Streptomyces sp. NPDC004111 TaxID=3364690 RepID=UPI0036786447